ncbi:hypothetical protein BC941DRAFT_446292, partial [Chlamydoabsidia padenii]
MARYDSLAEFFGYTHVEMVEELQAALEGQSFSWYTRGMVTLKSKYLQQYNEDSNPVMAAVDELKLIKLEKMTTGELASF